MLTRLRVKFVCINMAIVTAMLCLVFGLVLHFTQQSLEEESLQMLENSTSTGQWLFGQDSNQLRLPSFALILDPQTQVLTAIGGDYYDLSDKDTLWDLVNRSLNTGKETGILRDYGLRFYLRTISGETMLLFADATGEIATMRTLWRTCIAIGLASFALFLVLSLLLAQWAIKPVAAAWAQQRQFVADASHELKTPLTVIMTNAEMLAAPEYPAESKAQCAASILTMSQQMRGLVESLLSTARVDGTAGQMPQERLSLSKLTEEAALPFEPVFFEKDLILEIHIAPDIGVKGSASHLRQVVEILLDNAQKYSSPQGVTVLTLKKQSRFHCLLSVANPGPPIGEEDRKNIFKRFYRVDKARSMNHSYGLGLSIAQQIVQAHHGKIWADSRQGVNTFFVELPLTGSLS